MSGLTFSYAKKINHGTYRCFTSNQFGDSTSSRIVLQYSSPSEGSQGLDSGTIGGIVCGVIFAFVFCMGVFVFCYSKYMKQKYALYMKPDPKFRVSFQQSVHILRCFNVVTTFFTSEHRWNDVKTTLCVFVYYLSGIDVFSITWSNCACSIYPWFPGHTGHTRKCIISSVLVIMDDHFFGRDSCAFGIIILQNNCLSVNFFSINPVCVFDCGGLFCWSFFEEDDKFYCNLRRYSSSCVYQLHT